MNSFNNKSIITLICITALVFIGGIQIAQAKCHEKDFRALKDFYESTNGDNWSYNTGWEMVKNNDTPPVGCDLRQLKGVTVFAGRVVRLELAKNNITGKLPRTIYFLDKLELLALGDNELSGNIPNTIGYCKSLKGIDLKDNNLSYQIPSSIGLLRNLTHLCLGNNQLAGVIPSKIGNCTQLIRFEIYDNQISGAIPKEIGKLNKMMIFNAGKNQLSGTIPAELGACESLSHCSLNDNNLNSGIPSEIGNIPNLRKFQVNNNDLEGCYPVNLRKICITLEKFANKNYQVSDGNNFDESWEDFDQYFMGICPNPNKIASVSNQTIEVYPNPSKGFVNISVLEDNLSFDASTQLTIYNSTGSIVHNEKLDVHSSNIYSLDVRHLPKGNYFVMMNNAGEIYSQKLMIN